MSELAVVMRWLALAAALLLVGAFAMLLLAGRSARWPRHATAAAWEEQTLAWARWLAVLALVAGGGVLAFQAAQVTGRAEALLSPRAWLDVIAKTQFGTAWLTRQSLLLLVAALLLLRERERSTADWALFRAEAVLLSGLAVASLAWAGHAAAVESWRLISALMDALHLVAAGIWLGGLVPLALLLRAAATEAGADARPYAVLAVRRFSRAALAAVLVLVTTGFWNTWTQVGDVGGLVGTRYGALLLLKLALFLLVIVLAAVNRQRWLPALPGDARTVGRPVMARLARSVAVECALGLTIVALVSVLGVTPPARHDAAWWPFSHRLSWEATADLPNVRARVLIGSQLAVVGALALIAGGLLSRARGLLVSGGVAGLVMGGAIALPPLSVDAYPTTYLRPTVPYQALSIANGFELYRANCAVCHGVDGTGDGPGAVGLPRRPADLTGPHSAQHTAGDLFWWLSHGITAGGMPGFGDRLSEEERWDLVNYLRTLAAAEAARSLDPAVEQARPWLAAPDFTYAVGPGSPRTLRDFRGQRVVLLVLFSLPASRERLHALAAAHDLLLGLGAEVLAVPMDSEAGIIGRLGASPRILFPVVTEGHGEITRTYTMFRRTLTPEGLLPDPPIPAHMEFLIDRQGYLRGRDIPESTRARPGAPAAASWSDVRFLAEQIQVLNAEAPGVEPPDDHVH
ncbi:MAG: CopD family protein [Candidatus Rokubacteria bacterium]|nr:CopD family protein [Candidatus Rokubacteria bacterium]